MSTPLSATGRIILPYTVGTLTHKFRVFVRNPQVSGSTFNINTRATDSNDLDWEDAADALYEVFTNLMASGFNIGDAVLEKFVGGVWIVQAVHAVSGTNNAGGTVGEAWQQTLVLRDLQFHKLKLVVLGGNAITLRHYPSLSAMTTTAAALFTKEFTPTNTLTNAPYNWVVGRGNQYIAPSGVVGMTFAPNRKLRRRLGLT